MLRITRSLCIYGGVQKRTQLQDLRRVPGDRTFPGCETLRGLGVLQQPARRREAVRREGSGRRSQAIRTSLVFVPVARMSTATSGTSVAPYIPGPAIGRAFVQPTGYSQ